MNKIYNSRNNLLVINIVLISIVFFITNIFAQEKISTPKLFNSIRNDTSPPLRDMKNIPMTSSQWKNGIVPIHKNKVQYEEHYKNDSGLQTEMGNYGTSFIQQSWDGVSAGPYIPPDCSGDVGLNHYMEMVNVQFQIWDKTGNSLLGPLNLGTLWAGFPG